MYDYYLVGLEYTCPSCNTAGTSHNHSIGTHHESTEVTCEWCDVEFEFTLPCSADTVIRMMDFMHKTEWAGLMLDVARDLGITDDLDNFGYMLAKPWKWIGEITAYVWEHLDEFNWEQHVA